jgi:hypothetical protein
MKTLFITAIFGLMVPHALANSKADKIFDEYCGLQNKIQEYDKQEREQVKATLNAQDPKAKEFEKKKNAASNKQVQVSTQYQKLTGNYLSYSDCQLRNKPKMIIDPTERARLTVGKVECSRDAELGPQQVELFNGLISNGCLEDKDKRQSALQKLGKTSNLYQTEQSATFVLSMVAHDFPATPHFSKEAKSRASKLLDFYMHTADSACKGEIKGSSIMGDRTSDLCMEKNNLNSLYVLISVPVENIQKVACAEKGKVSDNDRMTALSLYEQKTGKKPTCDAAK